MKKWNEKERKVWKMITKMNEINIERKKEWKSWQDYRDEEKYNVYRKMKRKEEILTTLKWRKFKQ